MTKIAFREKGQGKTLICLHGYAGSVLHWEAVTQELLQYFRVLTPNLTHLYMGVELHTFSQQIDLIAEFIRTQSPNEPVCLMGISYGGSIAWGVATRYPELVERIVCINPMPPYAGRYFSIPSLRYFLRLPLPHLFVYGFLRSPLGTPFLQNVVSVFRNIQADSAENRVESLTGRKLKFVTHILWKFAWILRSENWAYWEAKLKEWRGHCLLIYDRKDPLFSPDFYDSFARKLSSNDVVSTQDAGHISIEQQPKLIAGVVRGYLLRDYFKAVDSIGF